jgi:hypothetical protein
MDYYGNYGFVGTFLDNDTLRFKRYYETGQQMYVDWFLYEFLDTSNITVERGTQQVDANPEDITLSTSDVTKTFSFVNLYSEYFSWDGDPDQQTFYHITTTVSSVDTLRIRANLVLPVGTAIHQAYWQVVTALDATVQKSNFSIPNTSTDYDVDVMAVDLTKTLVLMNYKLYDTSIVNPSTDHLKYARMVDSDTIRYVSYTAMSCDYASFYLVTFPSGMIVKEQGYFFWSGEYQDLDHASPANIDNVIINLTQHPICWSVSRTGGYDNFKDIGTTNTILDSDTTRFLRGDQDTSPVNVISAYQQIEFIFGLNLVNYNLTGKLTVGRLAC